MISKDEASHLKKIGTVTLTLPILLVFCKDKMKKSVQNNFVKKKKFLIGAINTNETGLILFILIKRTSYNQMVYI